MSNQSEREKLIERLKKDESERVKIPQDFIDDVNPSCLEDFTVLAEHWRYLENKKKNAKNLEEREKIADQIFKVRQYMLIAEFGDRNIARFNKF